MNNTKLLAAVLNHGTAVTQLTPKARGKEIPVGQLFMLDLWVDSIVAMHKR